MAIALYPVGVPALYWLLLSKAKDAIKNSQPNSLSRALDFLHRDFEPQCYFWEIIEVWKKLLYADLCLEHST